MIKASAAVVPSRCVGDRGEAAAQKSVPTGVGDGPPTLRSPMEDDATVRQVSSGFSPHRLLLLLIDQIASGEEGKREKRTRGISKAEFLLGFKNFWGSFPF